MDFKPVAPGWTVLWEGETYPLVGWATEDNWYSLPRPVLAGSAGVFTLPKGEHDWSVSG